MKQHVGFLGILLSVLGAFLYLAFNINEGDLFFFHGANEGVTHYLETFRQSHRPLLAINFSALYGQGNRFQVLHPLLDVRKPVEEPALVCRYPRDVGVEARDAGNSEASCQPDRFLLGDRTGGPLSEDSVKQSVLDRFIQDYTPLPPDFLTTPPLVSHTGHSYAFLLAERVGLAFHSKDWVERHLSFFKVSELAAILREYGIREPRYEILAKLTEAEVEEIIRGSALVLTKDYLFVKDESRLGFSPLSYWVFDLQEVRADLRGESYELAAQTPGALCLERLGNVCWTYTSKHALAYLSHYSLVILALVAALFLLILCLYLKHLHDKAREQRKSRLSLQVLSHEFRTPVTSFLMTLDQLTRRSLAFSEGDQDLITRLSSDAHRLQRILEISRTYLQAESRRIRFQPIAIASINDWITDFIVEHHPKVQCRLLPIDQGIRADPFWLKFVLSSLIQNAFDHGQEPVSVILEKRGRKLRLTVQDQGECEFRSLSQMTDAFAKSSHSRGMGLGLNIIKFIVDEWGNEIRFSRSPTAFTLLLSGLA